MKSVLGLVLVVALAGGCSGVTVVQRGAPADEARRLRRAEPVAEEAHRDPYRRRLVGPAPSRAAGDRIAAAVGDLKHLNLWRRLTRHLDHLRLRVRPGRSNVPRDAHLADSLYRFLSPGGGRLCRVTFYPRAMRDDLAKQRFYYDQGGLAERPPAMAEFWTMILAHELTHCRDERRGERIALRVEARVLEGLRLGGSD
jgi:hypothetical protein